MKKCFAFLILFSVFINMNAQRIGLVLSGGGARGIAHIGLIQALEDNDIPIDYVTGTSMGAIVGAMYAMGYTTDEMVALLKSDEFHLWQSGKIDDEYINFYKRKEDVPDILTVKTSFEGKVAHRKFLPESLINPQPMNFAFMKLFAHATVRCNGDFDNLFVPFRAVGSDVYSKRPIIFSEGELGDAVRASMTFPFVFKPIKINGILVYDGGIYNNFPVDVMQNDFAPEFIIGSVVSENPAIPEDGDLMGQIENMIMHKTNYDIDEAQGISIKFDLKNVSLLDFNKTDEIYKLGYEKGLEYADSIKSRVERRVTQDDVTIRRMNYVSSDPVIRISEVKIEGANTLQARYIRDQFNIPEDGSISLEEIERTYFGLLSDKKFHEILPSVVPKDDGTCDLVLKVKINSDLETSIGGVLSSMNANRFYFGLNYRNISMYAIDIDANTQVGKSYTSAVGQLRVDLPTRRPVYLLGRYSYISQNFYDSNKLFAMEDSPCFIKQTESYGLLEIGRPLGSKAKLMYGGGYASLSDNYYQSKQVDFSTTKADNSSYDFWQGFVGLEWNKITAKDFPTQGYRHRLIMRYAGGKGDDTIHDTEGRATRSAVNYYSWAEMKYSGDMYWNLAKKFTLGFSAETVISNKPLMANYTSTLLQSHAFAPTAYGKVTFNEAFRSNNFAAFGVKPIWKINEVFQLRSESYAFLPFNNIISANGVPEYGSFEFKPKFISELSAVIKLPFATISAFTNYYSAPSSQFTFGLTVGYVINSHRFFD